MDEETTARVCQFLLQEILRLNQNVWQLRAGIHLLKLTVGVLSGTEPKESLAQFQLAEEKILESDQYAQQLKEYSDLIELMRKHPPDPRANS